jgi:tryptophanase
VPHIPQSEFPAQALTIAIYREGGIRAVEIGSVAFAHQDLQTGEWIYPDLELVRMAIPRRVYTQSHLDYVVRVLTELWQKRDQIRGIKIVYQTKLLRHFTARFEPL